MIHVQALNIAPLRTIEAEINHAIQQASAAFESYLGDRSAVNFLQEAEKHIGQVRGALKLVQLQGAEQMAVAMVELLQWLIDNGDKAQDSQLSSLSQSFIALPCYLDYSITSEQAWPILVSPYINELKAACRKPLLNESNFSDFSVGTTQPSLPAIENTPEEPLSTAIRRLRHMYQVGLLAFIRDEGSAAKLGLMQRALDRLKNYTEEDALREVCYLALAVTEAFQDDKLEANVYRKRIMSQVDRYLRQVEKDGRVTASHNQVDELRAELLFLVVLGNSESQYNALVRQAYQLPSIDADDSMVRHRRSVMLGPNAATVASMVEAVREELTTAKEILEIAAQDVLSNSIDMQPLADTLDRVSDILKVVGLSRPAEILAQQFEVVNKWLAGEQIDKNNLLDMADSLLFVESSLMSIHHLDLNDNAMDGLSDFARHKMIASSHLAEAETLVVKEAHAGIALAKRAISSFIESNYDGVHISNVATTLNTVKGGLIVLGLGRAVQILEACVGFVDKALVQNKDRTNINEKLETLADALIALEYYLGEIADHGKADEGVLDVAEQSLETLGFPPSAE